MDVSNIRVKSELQLGNKTCLHPSAYINPVLNEWQLRVLERGVLALAGRFWMERNTKNIVFAEWLINFGAVHENICGT